MEEREVQKKKTYEKLEKKVKWKGKKKKKEKRRNESEQK